MIDSRYELIKIFQNKVHPLNFNECINNRLAGDFISKLVPLLQEKRCSYRIERRESIESGHIWLEVLSDCGESFEFENDAYRYFDFCPYCGGKMAKDKDI